MITIRDHQSGDLFDRWEFLGPQRRAMLENSWAGVFREHLLANLPVQKLTPHFKDGDGRPTKDLHVAMGVLILQQIHDLTDAQTVEAMAFNMAWHFALDLRDDSDAYLCERTLRNYRRKVIDSHLDELLFKGLTDRLVKAFGVDTTKQRIDSTALRSAMRNLTRLGCVAETISKFLRELARVHPGLHKKIAPELTRRYVEREGPGCFAMANPSESKRRLPEAGKDLAGLYLQHRDTDVRTLPSFILLERVFNEQFELVPEDDGGGENGAKKVRVREPEELPCDNVRNPSDPDSSYNTHRGQGYLAQFMETYQEDDNLPATAQPKPDLITHVALGKMTVHDSAALAPALNDTKTRGVQPKQLLGDTHYGPQENVKLASEMGTKLIAPAQTPRGAKEGRLTLEQFELDAQGQVVKCPQGHAPLTVSSSVEKFQARFDTALCETCPLKKLCPATSGVQRSEKNPRLVYAPERLALRTRRISEQSEDFKNRYRWRAGMEGTMSRLKHQMGLDILRVRGRKSVAYAVHLRALGLNIFRCGACKTA